MIHPVAMLTGATIAPFVGSAGSVIASHFNLHAVEKIARYAENERQPLEIPPFEIIVDLLTRKLIDKKAATALMLQMGIPIGDKFTNPTSKQAADAWLQAINLRLPLYDLPSAYAMYNKGLISQAQLDAVVLLSGDVQKRFSVMGKYQKETYSVSEIFSLYNRRILDTQHADDALKYMGGYDSTERDNILKLAKVIPPIPDIIRFAIRGAFDPDIVRTFGLNDEIERQPEFTAWANAQGLTTTDYTGANGIKHTANWVEKYWQAHWQFISPNQLYQMLHRLRPSRMGRYADIDPAMPPVTMEVVRQALRENDYAPYWRSPLVAINSLQMTRIDTRRAYNIDAIDRTEVTEQYIDRGYISQDAETLTKIADQQKKDYKLAEDKRRFGKWIEGSATTAINAYKSGAIDVASLTNALNAVYDDDAKVSLVVRVTTMQLDVERVRVYVKSIEREFMLGLYGPLQARAELTQAGVQPDSAQRYIDLWIRRLRYPRRVASTEKIIDWLRRGLITELDATSRLHNLGWSNPDILTWLMSAEQDIEKIKAREKASKARSEKQAALAGCDIVTCADKEHATLLKEVSKNYPISVIRKWYALTIITEEQARTLLKAHELQQFAIDSYITEWNKENTGG